MKKLCLMITAVCLLWTIDVPAENHVIGLCVPQPDFTMEGIQFVSGGIGIMERQAMEQMADDYTLKVIFARQDGHYLSRCRVEIDRTDGTNVLSTLTEGPWLLADLAPGEYRVKAKHDDIWKSMNIEVSEQTLEQVILNW